MFIRCTLRFRQIHWEQKVVPVGEQKQSNTTESRASRGPHSYSMSPARETIMVMFIIFLVLLTALASQQSAGVSIVGTSWRAGSGSGDHMRDSQATSKRQVPMGAKEPVKK